ncbi:MAG: OadG family protein [Oscillospiraceae bacterium]
MSNGQVILLGIGVVFVSLLIMIFVVKLMSLIIRAIRKDSAAPAVPSGSAAPAEAPVPAKLENRGEVIAAVSAAIAEDLGTDVSAIRILSFKQK